MYLYKDFVKPSSVYVVKAIVTELVLATSTERNIHPVPLASQHSGTFFVYGFLSDVVSYKTFNCKMVHE
jgi:hypothetical protein